MCWLMLHQVLEHALWFHYRFDYHDIPGMCHRNSAIASTVGRRDLVQAWTLAALSATASTQPASDLDDDIPWFHHPFGRAMVESL
jgi:hypothetical protein